MNELKDKVISHLACQACGYYDLHTLRAEGLCPECGVSVSKGICKQSKLDASRNRDAITNASGLLVFTLVVMTFFNVTLVAGNLGVGLAFIVVWFTLAVGGLCGAVVCWFRSGINEACAYLILMLASVGAAWMNFTYLMWSV